MNSAPFPTDQNMTEPKTGTIIARWLTSLRSLVFKADRSPQIRGRVALTAQVATIATTAIPVDAPQPGLPLGLEDGLFRISYYTRVTTPGSVSSSLTVTLGWTDGAVACAQAFTALTTNLTTSTQTGTILIRADAQTSLTYAVLYASAGTPMQFAWDLIVESLN